jgi:SEC-C motif-containing protein
MTAPLTSACPCGSLEPYVKCCEPFHLGQARPATAEQLMRSRYSAYALKLVDYLYQTHHPDKRPASAESLRAWAESVSFEKLEILGTSLGGPQDKIGKVSFCAHYRENSKPHSLQEVSRFRRYRGHWVYWDGEAQWA